MNFIKYGALIFIALQFSIQAAVLDTLEDIGPEGSSVTSRVIDGVTVNMTAVDRDLLAGTYYSTNNLVGRFSGGSGVINAPLNPANVSDTRFLGVHTAFQIVDPITFSFDQTIQGFGLTTVDLLESAELPTNFLTLNAYDSSNNIIASQTRNGSHGLSGLDLDWFVQSSSINISRVELVGNIRSGGFAIDDLLLARTSAVPEPSTYALLALGLISLSLFRKKRR